MYYLMLLAAFFQPVPSPATALDTTFTAAKAAWGAPTPAGFVIAGSIGIGRGQQDITRAIEMRQTHGLLISGESTSAVVKVADAANVPVTLDMTGSVEAVVRDLTIRADAHGGVALLLARRADGASAGNHRFENCHFEGPVIIEASEGNHWKGCTFRGIDARPALTLRNGTPKQYGSTMQSQDFEGCQFLNYHGGPAIVLQCDANAVLTDISFHGGQVATSGGAGQVGGGGEAAVVLRTGSVADRQMKMISFRNMRWETADRTVALLVKGTNGVIQLSLRDLTTHQRESIVRSESLAAWSLYAGLFEQIDSYPGDGSNGVHYAIDGGVLGGHVRLGNARGFKAAVRP